MYIVLGTVQPFGLKELQGVHRVQLVARHYVSFSGITTRISAGQHKPTIQTNGSSLKKWSDRRPVNVNCNVPHKGGDQYKH